MQSIKRKAVHIIGGGLAGSEAAWQLANANIPVILHEMRPGKKTFAHQTNKLAELVCSNSLRSDDAETSAVGLIHEEMRKCNSLVLASADAHRVPAGGALAVDREGFSEDITQKIKNHSLIEVSREEVRAFSEDWDEIIVATGPLTSDTLAAQILKLTGEESFAFFDAIAPIIYKDSIDFDKAWFQSRYDKGDGKDYINCPMSLKEYFTFIDGLIAAEKIAFKDWEKDTPYFEGCLPIEVMAMRGVETLRYGPLKPVGLTNPRAPLDKPYAIVQLRQDNALGTLYNMVGFQTKMTYGEQKRLLTTIPGLEKAEFARLGGIHRNSFINSPKLLNEKMQLKADPRMRFAGQITGVEGYIESAAMGLLTALLIIAERAGTPKKLPPPTTSMGALARHITLNACHESFQPMNVNFGLFEPLEERVNKKSRKKAYTDRGREDFNAWI